MCIHTQPFSFPIESLDLQRFDTREVHPWFNTDRHVGKRFYPDLFTVWFACGASIPWYRK